ITAELAWAARKGAIALPPDLASRVSVKAELIPVVLRRLGLRVLAAGSPDPDQHGPPSPAMVVPLRRVSAQGSRRSRPERAVVPAHSGPFAALAALRLSSGA
ncbi:MAG: DNA helicase, partial [Acetobacteraceae bacterium]|nr:DNA helicase [Acetobacteraceae bacterium]